MIVKCQKCGTAFEPNKVLIGPDSSEVLCPVCGQSFEAGLIKRTAETGTSPGYCAENTKNHPDLKYYFAALVIGLTVIIISVAAFDPWQELYRNIDIAKSIVGGTETSFSPSDLAKMNRFALNSALHREERPFYDEPDSQIYSAIAFGMISENDRLPSKKEVLKALKYTDMFHAEFDYRKLEVLYRYWEEKLAEEPGLKEILKESKRKLVKTKENAIHAGFKVNQIMIMLDSGKKTDLFENSILYVSDSAQWRKDVPATIGEIYEVPNNEFWRELALKGTPGYGHNPVFDKWYLPRFDVDEYGTWFSVWFTCETEKYFNTYGIDFEASRVKQKFVSVFRTVAGVIVILIVVISVIRSYGKQQRAGQTAPPGT